MAFGFKKRELFEYKILEKYKIDIAKTNKRFLKKGPYTFGPKEYCKLIGESNQYKFYCYKTYHDDSGGYILRQSKLDNKDVVYFGYSYNVNRVFHNYLLQLRKRYDIGSLEVMAKNVNTAKEEKFEFLSRKTYDFARKGIDKFNFYDEVTGVFTKDDKLFFKLTRQTRYSSPESSSDTRASDSTFYLVATYKNNQLNIKDIYPSDKNNFDTETKFRRNEEKHIKCNFKGNEQKCSKRCAACVIHLKDLADEACKQNNWEEALTLYKKAAFIEPEFADAWLGLGKALTAMEDNINALAAFDKAIEIDELYQEAYFNKAITLRKLGRLNEAVIIVNDLLAAGKNPNVIELKEKLINLGTKDVYKLDTAIKIITNKALEIASQNDLLNEDGEVKTEKDIYKKNEFASQIYGFCKKEYGLLGKEKLCCESIIKSFYASICATLIYYRDRNSFADIHPFEYLKDHIDLERADAEAERMLGMKSGETESESLWNIIYAFAQFSSNIISKVDINDSETAIINATENAYLLGMLYAMNYHEEQLSYDRKKIDADLEKLAESSEGYSIPPVRGAMCYSVSVVGETPTKVFYDFKCDKCGLYKRIKIDDLDGKEQKTVELYKKIAKQYDSLGFKCEVKCYCDDCANKFFPSKSKHYINNIIFSVKIPGTNKIVHSFPHKWGQVDTKYQNTLDFLRKANETESLQTVTNKEFEKQNYLKDVKAVLGENYGK